MRDDLLVLLRCMCIFWVCKRLVTTSLTHDSFVFAVLMPSARVLCLQRTPCTLQVTMQAVVFLSATSFPGPPHAARCTTRHTLANRHHARAELQNGKLNSGQLSDNAFVNTFHFLNLGCFSFSQLMFFHLRFWSCLC
jgi:hypothetical protein